MSQFNVYKSSAGSGKTFTLVKSYLSIALKDTTVPPVAYKSILAITFTNKAAGEMKERVVSTLRSISESGIQDNMGELLCLELKITSDEIKLRAANLLNAILHNYSDFSIGTIDRFVHRVIRTFALDLKLPMNFSIETNTELVLARCVDELIGKVGNDPVLTDVLLNFSRSKAEDQKNWRVETELLLFIKKFIAEETDEIFHGIKNHDIPSLMEAAKYMRAYMRDFLEELKQKAAVNDLWIKNQGLESTDFTQGGRGVYSYFTKIADGEYLNNVYGAYVKAAVEEDKWKSGKSNLSDDQISYLKSKILELEEFRKQGLEKHKIYSAILKNIYSLMVIHELQTIFLKIKQEENFVFISEFNSLISEIINTQPVPFVYERIGEKYKHYLLDEFQDTSVIQWNNLLPLVDNSLASGNFNMVVGDGKQSIYRWRGGDVDQFADLPKIQGKKNKVTQESWDSLIRNYREDILKTNFRSKEEIVDFNNQFFDHAREKIIPEKYQKVYKDSKQEPKTNSKGGFVSFDLIDPSENSEISKLEVCALVENYINKNCKEFGYNYSDITILVRTKRNGKLIADFLLSKNIPIVSSETLLLSSNPGVCMLLGLMNLLQTERDQIDEAKIIRYFSGRAEMNYQSFDLLWKEFNRSTGSVWTFMKQKKFIQHNREYFSGLPLYELCCALIREFRPDAADNIFIQFFLDEIIKYSKNNPENLSSFIEWWQQNGKNCSAILPSGANAVNILTIHTSKGLQFPVVIIPFADWETYKSNPVWLEVNEPELPALNVAMIDSPGSLNETKYSGVATVEKEKQILDNVNLLYVATTRAEDHLHIISRKYGRVDHIDKWLSEFFEKNFPRSENQKMHIKGVMQKKHSKEKLSVNTLDYSLELNSRTDLLELKLSHQKDNKRLSASGKLEYGILFHEAMRHIDSVQDVARIKDVLLSKTICSAELASEIQVKISSLMNQQKFAAFFDSGKRSVNEPELISGTGDFRPDRLIFSENEVILVEYKTGEKDEKHQEQVMNYAGLISEIFSCKTRCFLVYVEEEIIEEVI